MQVLWERGWIDEGNIDKYTMDIAKDKNDGEDMEDAENWSLKYLMASCLDFAEEMTALQHGHALGVSVLITPKFHAEMAGEGIEYSWGCRRVSTAKCHWILKGKDIFQGVSERMYKQRCPQNSDSAKAFDGHDHTYVHTLSFINKT
ncbi:hypothetical protein MHU86_21027 [Fragilaria crotonensis]|nr:hypothetical protein MHU86_21027 [Fragilaria crotonensis]